jgi:hypothetical protein
VTQAQNPVTPLNALARENDALRAELERERHANELLGSANETLAARNAELVTELERVKAERDEYVIQGDWPLTKVEVQLSKALAALREIESGSWGRKAQQVDYDVCQFARAAIAEIESSP